MRGFWRPRSIALDVIQTAASLYQSTVQYGNNGLKPVCKIVFLVDAEGVRLPLCARCYRDAYLSEHLGWLCWHKLCPRKYVERCFLQSWFQTLRSHQHEQAWYEFIQKPFFIVSCKTLVTQHTLTALLDPAGVMIRAKDNTSRLIGFSFSAQSSTGTST